MVLEYFSGRNPSACWEWPRARTAGGYGQLCINYKVFYTHRLAFEEANGRPPQGVVRHSCDNPPCCNPAHLLDGSRRQNTHDSLRRMRQPKVKLTWEKAAAIRERFASGGISHAALAREYGVSDRLIFNVVNGKAWPQEAAP